jgi:NADH:ubiquinone oxidoreductase subunit K
MAIEWYIVLSAMLFTIGFIGVLVRRNPVVILLCLELMLSAGALSMLAFSRMLGDQDGQVMVLVVLVVAACEVVVGLGLVVAMFRRRLPLDVDDMKELQG